MVTIKGKEISEDLALDSIKAMERLIYLYKNPKDFLCCPLCRMNVECEYCPWHILKNTTCHSFVWVVEDPLAKRNRIRQLRRWIKIYQKALGAK